MEEKLDVESILRETYGHESDFVSERCTIIWPNTKHFIVTFHGRMFGRLAWMKRFSKRVAELLPPKTNLTFELNTTPEAKAPLLVPFTLAIPLPPLIDPFNLAIPPSPV